MSQMPTSFIAFKIEASWQCVMVGIYTVTTRAWLFPVIDCSLTPARALYPRPDFPPYAQRQNLEASWSVSAHPVGSGRHRRQGGHQPP
jgi:hypothetical protein